tara:strand:- start:9340 stop:9669 length:330 start_codon:yes stop_codon:yes gene_type:complete
MANELQSKKALRRNGINPDDLPQNIKDKYDELLDTAEYLTDDDLWGDERVEIEVKVTAKDEACLQIIRRYAREIASNKETKDRRDGNSNTAAPEPTKSPDKPTKVFKYL